LHFNRTCSAPFTPWHDFGVKRLLLHGKVPKTQVRTGKVAFEALWFCKDVVWRLRATEYKAAELVCYVIIEKRNDKK